ncbi:MAG: Fe-S cluster biogenesis protein NfuA [Dinoroseobacter sp.]|jgi:Fe-S cluster biogenesis protein NfuA
MSDAPVARRIRVQTTPKDPLTLRFILDLPVQGQASARYEDASADAPLARALFAISGVRRIEVDGTFIHVSRSPDENWATMKAPIAAAIRDVLDEDALPLGKGSDTPKDADALLLVAVGDLLDREANPSIASHGGKVSVDRVENGDVYLRMSGGCQGCAASAATLRNGIETMLRAALPAIREIIDLTDHDAGTKPFYAGASGKSPTLNRWLPPDAIGWEDDQIIIDPDYLAPRLGLTPDTLRAGLRSGEIVSLSERGLDADAGKIRVTVRTPFRAWSAEMFTDGTAREVPPLRKTSSHSDGEETLADQVRRHLQNLPDDNVLISYEKLARALGHWAPGSIGRVTKALEQTMREDAATATPFIAVRAVSRGEDKLPGKGFFELARALKRGPVDGETDRDLHDRLLDEVDAFLDGNQQSAPE